MGRNASESPVGGRGSPWRRRERSPAQHRGSSLKRVRSPPPVSLSPSPRSRRVRRAQCDKEVERNCSRGSDRGELERNYSRGSSPKRAGSRSRSLSSGSPSPSPRTRRMRRAQEEKGSEKGLERNYSRGSDKGERDRHSSHGRSPKRAASASPYSRSPSPRSRRLKRVQAGRDGDEIVMERERDRNGGRSSEKNRHSEREYREKERERRLDRESERERRDRRSGREDIDDRTRHRRSASPSNGHRRSRHRSRSPHYDSARDEGHESRGADQRNDNEDSLAKMQAAEEALQTKEKEKPSFELSGKLAAETNRFRGVTLLFNEPPDARKPDIRWRLYVFKGGEVLNEPLYIHRQSCYLFGRERRVADIPTDHPSCSKQHAVIQFRQVEKERPDGTLSKQVNPYLMDLGSTNKTFLNDNPIEPQRYYELFEKDTIKFGNSSREYVLLHENSVQ